MSDCPSGVHTVRTIQELLAHKDVSATMIYTHALNKGRHGVRSPISGLCPGLYRLYRPCSASSRMVGDYFSFQMADFA